MQHRRLADHPLQKDLCHQRESERSALLARIIRPFPNQWPVLVCTHDREMLPSHCPLRPNPWYVWGTVSMKDDHSSSGKLGLSKIESKPNLTTSRISVNMVAMISGSAKAVRHAAPSSLRRFSVHCRRSFKASQKQTQALRHI